MTLSRVEVITSVERRRRWPRAEKERLVALALEPGASASEIARSAGVHVSQLFRWRKQLCERGVSGVSCGGGHDGPYGGSRWPDAKPPVFVTNCWTSCWPVPI
ncbi:transposase, partial [Xanthobacter sp. KR7-65]|uniref:transposase n=1 Tax=Xanthobacter sp. KR7-65 TaxID=3156612 RepID=UPI0032B5F207